MTKISNLMYDSTQYNMKDYNFFFNIFSQFGGTSILLDTSYFSLEMYQVNQKADAVGNLNKTYTIQKIPVSYWGNKYDDIIGASISTLLNLNSTLCPDTSLISN